MGLTVRIPDPDNPHHTQGWYQDVALSDILNGQSFSPLIQREVACRLGAMETLAYPEYQIKQIAKMYGVEIV